MKIFVIALMLVFELSVHGNSLGHEKDKKQNFLWRCSRGEHVLYLMGSIHLGKKDLYPLNFEALKAYKQSEFLALEIDMNPQNMLAAQQFIMENGTFRNDQDLNFYFDKDELKLIEDWMKNLGLPKAQWIKMKPWFLYLMSMNIAGAWSGMEATYGIDQHYLKMANRDKKTILELESVYKQMQVISTLPDIDKVLLESLKMSKEESIAEMERLFQCVKQGDSKTLIKILKELKSESEAFYRAFLIDRNIRMVQKIDQWAEDGKQVFVVVGAAHLLGEKGLVPLLKAKGFSLDRM